MKQLFCKVSVSLWELAEGLLTTAPGGGHSCKCCLNAKPLLSLRFWFQAAEGLRSSWQAASGKEHPEHVEGGELGSQHLLPHWIWEQNICGLGPKLAECSLCAPPPPLLGAVGEVRLQNFPQAI